MARWHVAASNVATQGAPSTGGKPLENLLPEGAFSMFQRSYSAIHQRLI
jgi:hypothetical protein